MTSSEPISPMNVLDSLFPEPADIDSVYREFIGHETALRVICAVRIAEWARDNGGPVPRVTLSDLRSPSFGTWVSLVEKLATGSSRLVPSLTSWIEVAKPLLNKLVELRNQLMHGRVDVNLRRAEVIDLSRRLRSDHPLVGLQLEPGVAFRLDAVRGDKRVDLWPLMASGPAEAGVAKYVFRRVEPAGVGLDPLPGAFGASPPPRPPLADLDRLLAREDWVSREARLEDRGALATELIRRARDAPRKRLLLISGGPGSGKTAVIASVAKKLRDDGALVAAYRVGDLGGSQVEGVRQALEAVRPEKDGASRSRRPVDRVVRHARAIASEGPLWVVIDGFDDARELRPLAEALMADGHFVLVTARSQDTLRSLEVEPLMKELTLDVPEEVAERWVVEAISGSATPHAPSSRRWVQKLVEKARGHALHLQQMVQRIQRGDLRVGQDPPGLDDFWDKLLDEAGSLDDDGRLAPVLLAIASYLQDPYTSPQVLEALLGRPPERALELLGDLLAIERKVKGRVLRLTSHHPSLRAFLLRTPRLVEARQLAKRALFEGIYDAHRFVCAHPAYLARSLDAVAEAWNRFHDGGAVLRWLDYTHVDDAREELAAWIHFCHGAIPPSLAAWLDALRRCTDPGERVPQFYLDRVYETDSTSPMRRCLVGGPVEPRPCRPRKALEHPLSFAYPADVGRAALGERGDYLAALTDGGQLYVHDARTGRELARIEHSALGPGTTDDCQVAVSDKLGVAVAWRGCGDVVVELRFREDPPQAREVAWKGHRIEMAPGHHEDGVDMLEALLAYQEARSDWREVGENAKSWRRHDATWIYERADLGLVLRPTIDDPSVLELLPGEQAGGPRTNHCAGLAVADGKIAVREGRWIRVLDLGGRELQRLDAGNAKWHQGIPGVADFVEQFHVEADPTDHAEGTLTRLEPGPGGLVLRPVGLCTFTDGAPVDPRLWQYRERIWHRPGGEPVAPHQPSHGLTAELAEGQPQHVLVRDREGHVVADWWSAVPLNQAAMVSASELALLTERLEVIVLDVDLPS